jgi:hypothetical protein
VVCRPQGTNQPGDPHANFSHGWDFDFGSQQTLEANYGALGRRLQKAEEISVLTVGMDNAYLRSVKGGGRRGALGSRGLAVPWFSYIFVELC